MGIPDSGYRLFKERYITPVPMTLQTCSPFLESFEDNRQWYAPTYPLPSASATIVNGMR